MARLRCPSCDKSLNVPDELAGKKAKCPGCQGILIIPEASVQVTPIAPKPGRLAPPPIPDESPDETDRAPRRTASRGRDAEYDDRPRRRPRADDYDDEDRPPRRRAHNEWADCPKCGDNEAIRIHWTFWGGMIGPAIINTVRCARCGTSYNGVKGDYNTTRIAIYIGVNFILGVMIVGALIAFQMMD